MKKRQWLIELRKEQGLGLTEISKKIGTTTQFYYYIENGDRRPSPEIAQKIGDILGFNWTMFYPKEEQKQ